jgi:FtsP/CotA-like multicopper oxidase with cupredoxin domain
MNDKKAPTTAIGRRDFIKAGIAATAAPLVITARKSEAQVAPVIPPSPPTAEYAWMMDLPIRAPLEQSTSLNPSPAGRANTMEGECGRDRHPTWSTYLPASTDFYEIRAQEALHTFTPALTIPQQPIWGYNGIYPGPTIHARYGRQAMVRMYNELPQEHIGFGSPEISTHLHNLHCPSESDGFPGDYFSPTKYGPTLTGPGIYKDHLYPNVRAGYTDSPSTFGDPRESLGTLWFHDHTLDSTASNVYKGLIGFYLMFDEFDSGDENDPNPAALRLPSGKYDIPIAIQDKRFTPDGQLYWDQLNPEGVLGDRYLVNGVIQPVLHVEPRKYRFRILNGGPTRSYELYFVRRGTTQLQPFTYIANDGNLLPAPLASSALRNPKGGSAHGIHMGVAERADIVFDFSQYGYGTEILLINRLEQLSTRKPEKDLLGISAINTNPALQAHQLLLIKVDRPLQALDTSRVPSVLRALRPLPTASELAALPVRSWTFERSGGVWVVNGNVFNVNRTDASIKKGAAEIWELRNPSGGWTHPLHIHFEEGRILSRVDELGKTVSMGAQEAGRKDVYVLHPGHTVRVLMRFRDFTGKYPMHCHNLAHEDHAMMVRWEITD